MKKTQVKKPRASAKNFPDLPKAKATQVARTANQVIDVLWPLPPGQRGSILEKALVMLHKEG